MLNSSEVNSWPRICIRKSVSCYRSPVSLIDTSLLPLWTTTMLWRSRLERHLDHVAYIHHIHHSVSDALHAFFIQVSEENVIPDEWHNKPVTQRKCFLLKCLKCKSCWSQPQAYLCLHTFFTHSDKKSMDSYLAFSSKPDTIMTTDHFPEPLNVRSSTTKLSPNKTLASAGAEFFNRLPFLTINQCCQSTVKHSL